MWISIHPALMLHPTRNRLDSSANNTHTYKHTQTLSLSLVIVDHVRLTLALLEPARPLDMDSRELTTSIKLSVLM